ncbi:MAG: SH3 domain-containing protein, partial [Pseudomonadota bacterium]
PAGNPGINPGGNPVRVADSIVSTPREISVGKWPLGMVHDGNQLWVAESGQRTIAAIDFDTGQIIERKRVGRLPTSMARSDDGTVFTLVATDQLIRRFSPGGRERVLARLGTCPEEMIFADGNVWAMTLPQCSSESSRIVRIDPQTGRQSRSAVLGEWGKAMTAYGGEIFVFHTRSPELTVVDMGSMNHTTYSVPGLSFWSAAQNASRVFGGGRVQRTKDEGLVLAFDPVSRQETARASVSERVVQLHANDQHVVALGSQGTMWVFDEATLELKRTITPSTGVYSPRVMLEHNGFLLVSSYAEPSGQGSIFVFDNWEPAGLNGDPGDPGVPGNPGANPNARAFPVGAGSWGGNVRNGPGTTFSLVTSLAQGEPVTLLSETTVIFNGYPWFEIQFRGGQTGYQWGGILCGTERPVSGIYQMCTGSPAADGQGNN